MHSTSTTNVSPRQFSSMQTFEYQRAKISLFGLNLGLENNSIDGCQKMVPLLQRRATHEKWASDASDAVFELVLYGKTISTIHSRKATARWFSAVPAAKPVLLAEKRGESGRSLKLYAAASFKTPAWLLYALELMCILARQMALLSRVTRLDC